MHRRTSGSVAVPSLARRRLLPLLLLGLAMFALITLGQTSTAHAGTSSSVTQSPCPGTGAAPNCPPPPPDTPPGSLTVTKVVVGGPAVPSDFSFVVTVGGAPVSGVQSPPLGFDSTSFLIAFNAIATVEEVASPPNYTQTASTCVNIALGLGLDLACTITNTFVPAPGSLTVHKVTTEPTPETFNFTSALGNFTLGNGDSQSFAALAAGAYAITESSLPAGWVLQGAVCTGSDPGTLLLDTLTVNLASGEDIICTFTNQAPVPDTPPVSDPVTPPADNPAIDLEADVSGQNNGASLAALDGLRSAQTLQVTSGSAIFWTFRVENIGDVVLNDVLVTHDAGTPNDLTDDVIVLSGLTLTPGQVVVRTLPGVAITGVLTADNVAFGTGGVPARTVSDADPATYEGILAQVITDPPDAPAALPNTGSGGLAGTQPAGGWVLLLVVGPLAASAVVWSRRSTRR